MGMAILSPSLKLAFLLSLSFATTSSSFSSQLPFLTPHKPSKTRPDPPKATASDLLALLSTPQQASSVNAREARLLKSCFKFLVPFSPTRPVPQPVARPGRRALGSWPGWKREDDGNELIWWPPEAVMELAWLAVDSGGDVAAIQGALDPTVISVSLFMCVDMFCFALLCD